MYSWNSVGSKNGSAGMFLISLDWKNKTDRLRQEPLPGPREELAIDWTLGDAELFERYFFPLGRISHEFLGDMWHDVAWPII